jgi:hypothetical protein
MNEIELTPEQQEELREALQHMVKVAQEICDAICEAVSQVMEKIRQIAIELGRFFLKLQLLEWKIPYPLAEFTSRNIYWYWAVRLGFGWFQRKLLLVE